jgi:alpha-tubulin suppressor-like RCC1 family protein
VSLIRFSGDTQKRIGFIACGGEHIFALSKNNELFGWGRNEDG